jgi:hypothetical protein
MKIVVAQFYTDNVTYGDFARQINERYCQLNGYTYFVERDTKKIRERLEGRSWTWYKPHLISDVFEQHPDCDYVLFLDIDAIFSSDTRRIEEFIDEDSSLIMTSDYGPSIVNAGVMLLKNDDYSKKFIKDWWDICEEHPKYKTALWHDQTCIGLLRPQMDISRFKIIDPFDLNARDYQEDKLIFHAFSYGLVPFRTLDSIYYKKFGIEVDLSIKSLHELGNFHRTDKAHFHDYYNRFYQKTFESFHKKCDLLEIGVLDGSSLKVWKDFFTEGTIHGIDINEIELNSERIKTFVVDQSKEEDLYNFSHRGYEYDVIIDDGSHKMYDVQITAQILFKNLKSGGLFIIEDLQTSLECRMPEKRIFGWGDPDKTTALDMLYSIQEGKPHTDFKTSVWDYFVNNIESISISQDRDDSIYAIIKKK